MNEELKIQSNIVEKLDEIASYLNESGPLVEIAKSLNDIATTLERILQRM